MTSLPVSLIFDIVQPELLPKQRREARRALRKIASVLVFYLDDSVLVRFAPYIDEELTSAEEDVVLELEKILVRNVDRLVDAIEAGANK